MPSAIAWQLGEDRGVVVLSGARAVEDGRRTLGPLARTQLDQLVRLAGKLFATASAELTKPLRRS